MIVHLYIAPSVVECDDFLIYDSKISIKDDSLNELYHHVVKHYIQRLLEKKEVPYDIEQHFENVFAEEQRGCSSSSNDSEGNQHNHQNYLTEMSSDDYHTMLRRIMENKADCKAIFTYWTQYKLDADTLVCISETDMCAPFILNRFPPVEMYTRTCMRMDIEGEEDDAIGICGSDCGGGGEGDGDGDGDGSADDGDGDENRDGPDE
jgi:hypothetical protein